MVFDIDSFRKEGKSDFSRLSTLYILALSAIATSIIIGQFLIQNFLKDQFYDSRVINVAGRQRMLSQKISKIVLKMEKADETGEMAALYQDLKATSYLWKTSQEGLLYGNDTLHLPGSNSNTIKKMFEQNALYYLKIIGSCETILSKIEADAEVEASELQPFISVILSNEAAFLNSMDAIVFQYDAEASRKIKRLTITEYILLVVALAIILLEILYIFKPTAQNVTRTLNKLIESEKNAQKMSKEIGVLYSSLEKSYEELSSLNQPVENPRLLAKADRGGNLKFVSDLYADLTGYGKAEVGATFADLIPGVDNPEDLMDELIDTISEGSSWSREVKFSSKTNTEVWLDITVTPVFNNKREVTELLVIGTDLTKRKEAESKMYKKDRSEIEKRISEQKFRSVLILEGQEEERKRIAMDIHDGIGQMLTSLKFQIESIDMSNYGDARNKLNDAKELIKDVIKEVRRVTFNLKPTALSDYGISAGLGVFIKEINKLTNVEVVFENRTNFNKRLPTKIENNIYRIVQEAINNAIKYAKTHRLEVIMYHDTEGLTIVVKDEGVGFDEKILKKPNFKAESGNGFFNMFERTEYINGKLEISSTIGAGTSVTLIVPLKEYL